MCENIDWNVGRVLQKLEELKISDHTIVMYFSDNGPNSHRWNGGMKGIKGSTDEGGVREPFFIRWPGKIPAGSTCDDMLMTIDLFPSIAKLIGAQLPDRKIDGLEALPRPVLVVVANVQGDRTAIAGGEHGDGIAPPAGGRLGRGHPRYPLLEGQP